MTATRSLLLDRFGEALRWRWVRGTGAGRDERGGILIFALIFLVAVGLVGLTLDNWATNNLNNSSTFKTARSLQTAANSMTQLAMQGMRYTPLLASGQTLNASPPGSCWSSSTPTLPNSFGYNLTSWCSTAWSPTSASTRVVTISTCANSLSATACAANPVLQAVVTFDDYPPGIYVPTTSLCVVYCGNSETVNSWIWSPTVPSVSAISPTSGPITGGTQITVTGQNFTSSTKVNLVDATLSDNVTLAATNVTVNSSTSLTATIPAMTTGLSYEVTVTTLGGTSAYGPVFSYSAVAPIVALITPSSGTTGGGTSIAITGTGFVSGATVTLTQESGGVALVPAVTLTPTVSSLTPISMVVTTPSVLAGATYFLTVTTQNGTSTTGSNTIFTFTSLPPVVSAISPSSGPQSGGTGFTITGSGFVSGATVNFVQELLGIPLLYKVSDPNITVTGSTTIVGTTPAVSVGTTYYVTVTTPGGTSAYGSVFTF